MQEVDESAYNKYLTPIFSQHGYVSHHTTKNGTTVEGCATFVSTATFTMLHTADISLRDVMESQSTDPESSLHKLFHHKPNVYDILTKKITTIAQISILRYKHNPHHLCLAVNTHLFYHPDAAYIRLLQIHEIMQQLELIKSSILSCNGENAESKLQIYLHSLMTSDQQDEALKNQMNNLDIESTDNLAKELSRCVLEGGAEDSALKRDTDTELRGDLSFEVSCFVFGDLNSSARTGAIEYLEK
jgi:mRNA deadenylase 3'-5' endonuclease subunit Ccr4